MAKELNYSGQSYTQTSRLRIPEYQPKWESGSKKDTIRKSIQRFGIKSPLIVNGNPQRANIIVHGVLVFRIAQELGIEEVPVMYVDLDLEEEKQLRVLLDQKGTLALTPDEIIELIGQLDYEAFFGEAISDTLTTHIAKAEKQVAANPPRPKKAIKQLLIRLSAEDNETFKSVMKEMGVATSSDAIKALMEIFKHWKNDLQKNH